MKHIQDTVWVTASGHTENNDQRIARLKRVVQRLSQVTKNHLRRLHDHKGSLTAWWIDPAALTYCYDLNASWEAEDEEIVEHRLENGTLVLVTRFGKLVPPDYSTPASWPVEEQ